MARPFRRGPRSCAPIIFTILLALAGASCSPAKGKSAVIWTETPGILPAAELFNASQKRQLVEVHYVEDIPAALRSADVQPSLVIGKGFRNLGNSADFQSLEYLFGELLLSRSAFHSALLDSGVVGGRRLFLPLSFDATLVMFPKGAIEAENSSMITMNEIKTHSAAFNRQSEGVFSRMGFSPRWGSGGFLFDWAEFMGSAFAESRDAKAAPSSVPGSAAGYPLSWNPESLARAAGSIARYSAEINGSAEKEDAFAFTYLTGPFPKSVAEGRILFSALPASEYFLMPQAARSQFDFRFFSVDGRIAIDGEICCAAIPRRGKNKETAEQFLKWLFSPENQMALMEHGRLTRLSESQFGIAGGFSTLREVTEKTFPMYYPDLVGRVPQASALIAPGIFPENWHKVKTEMIIPWLRDVATLKTAAPNAAGSDPEADFREKLQAYLDRYPEL